MSAFVRLHCRYEDGVDGPPRVWLRDEGVPGLAMSRSVGDTIAKQAGVCSEVEVQQVSRVFSA